MNPPDYYTVLGVSATSEDVVIQAAYRALMRKYHPDLNRGQTASAETKAKLINEAYETLRDPLRRAAYDASHRAGPAREERPPPRPTPPRSPPPPPQPSAPPPEQPIYRSPEHGAWLGSVKSLLLIVGGLAVLAMMAGLFQGGNREVNDVRSSFRENAVNSCVTASRNAPGGSQFDWPRLCGCAIDRYMAGKSTSDLRNADPQDPALRAATQQCAMEQVGAASGAPAAGEPAGEEGNAAKPGD